MRKLLVFILFISYASAKAQTTLPLSSIDSTQKMYENNNSINTKLNKKWSLITYSNISTGFSFFRGGNAFMIAAPLGIQLNRRLNNNFYAFAGLSAAPSYINFNNPFLSSGIDKLNPGNSFYKPNNFGVYSRAELGLIYVNDARTFSISGSIGVERSSNPLYFYRPVNAARTTPVILPGR